ncbi:MAG: PqqD family protein [Bacteroidales bacterium]|nr:PqqD family protein [Bacteroidales bacterium]
MKTIEGFVLRPLGEEYIVIGEGIAQVDFNRMISMNSSAAYLWSKVEGKEFTVEDLKDLLLEEYEVDPDTAAADAAAVAAKWVEAGIVSE